MGKKSILLISLIFSLFILLESAHASTENVFGPKFLKIKRWGMHLSFHRFEVKDSDTGILSIRKSTPDKKLRDGFVFLNGRIISLKRFFRGSDAVLEEKVTLRKRSRMLVFFWGQRRAGITITVRFPPPEVIFSATPERILYGESATLTWDSEHADYVTIEPGIGSVDLNGFLAVSPMETTIYTITATGLGGTATANVTVTVSQPLPTVSIQAELATINQGQSTMLTWTSENATTIQLTPWSDPFSTPSLNGSVSVSPEITTTYVIVASNEAGSNQSDVTVTVLVPEPELTFSVAPATILLGESAVLSWTSTNAETASIDQGIGDVDLTGSLSVSPTETTTYTITVTGPGGTKTESVTVSVTLPEPTVTLTAEPDTIFAENIVVLSWTSTNADSAFITPDIGSVPVSASVTVSPTESVTYTITATGPGGTAEASASVTILTPSQSSIKITDPADGSYVETSTISVTGTVDIPDANVFVNGLEASVTGGIFTLDSVSLQPGANRIIATASGSGLVKTDTIWVVRDYTYQPQPENSFGEKYEDLVPSDSTVASYDSKRFAVITGDIQTTDNLPLQGVTVAVLNHPEYGTALSDANGRFSIAVNGGDLLTLTYELNGMLATYRQVQTNWNDIVVVDTVKMVAKDAAVTAVNLDGNESTIVTHQSDVMTDEFGSRSFTAVLSGDNRAFAIDENGNQGAEINNFTLRATQVPDPESMPAILPPNSAYTYCVDIGIDGFDNVRFEKPIPTWVENFLGFDTGTIIPVGFYDEQEGAWVPSDNGVVVVLLDTDKDGITDALDADGDGLPDDLNQDGDIHDEVKGLDDPLIYPPGGSFWRVEVNHFSILDLNFPAGPPGDSTTPNPNADPNADKEGKASDRCGKTTSSIVDQRSRVFHDDIPIPGTDITLHYASNRVEGYRHKIIIPASGSSVPASLKRIIVKTELAGRAWEWDLQPLPDQKVELMWDGIDFLGRPVIGPAIAHVKIGFVYDGYYSVPAPLDRSFGQPGGVSTGIPAQQEIILWKRNDIHLDKGRGTIAEGWTLSPHHDVSLVDLTTLYLGSGGVTKNYSEIISTVKQMNNVGDIAADGAGNLYIARSAMDIVDKLDTDGNLTRIVGNGNNGFSGDGGSADQAQLHNTHGVALDTAGNVYIADFSNCRIRKVSLDGIITTFAGSDSCGFSGDGGLATDASLNGPIDIEVDTSGNVYIAEYYNNRIRKVDPDGIITTVAGNGGANYGADGGFAFETEIGQVWHIAVDQVGNLFFSTSTSHRIGKVDTEGIMTTFAGTIGGGYSGDGGPAIEAKLTQPGHIAVDTVGNLYISDRLNNRVRMVNTLGIITTVAGNGETGSGGDGGSATTAQVETPGALTVGPQGDLYVTSEDRIRKIGPIDAFQSYLNPGEIPFAEETGVGHVMSANGRHQNTIDLKTGVTLKTFQYNAEGQISAIVDRFGDQITIERDLNGVPAAIISPDGIRTDLVIDPENRLTSINYPDGGSYTFDYSTDGLLTIKTEPKGNQFDHTFDGLGRVTDATDQEGGHWIFERAEYATGESEITVTSGEGNITSFLDYYSPDGTYNSTITDPTGAQTQYTESADQLQVTKSLPCGMTLDYRNDIDPEYRFEYVTEFTETAPSGLSRNTKILNTYEDTNLDGSTDLFTESVSVNGKNTTFEHDTTSSIKTITSPEGRTVTSHYDSATLLPSSVSVPGLFDTTYGYDARGRTTSINTNTRNTVFTYNTEGFLESVTDPENHTTTYGYDDAGRLTAVNRPDGGSIEFTYDLNGNLTVLTTPVTVDHGFGFNNVNLNSSYQTPISGSYSYVYGKDRRLIQTIFPSGSQINNIYDTSKLVQIQTPEGNIDYTYLCGTKVESITKGTESITYGYDGKLVTSETMSGTLNQSLDYVYNNDFVLSESTYAGDTTTYTYDNDGLLTGAGSFIITRNAGNGLPEVVTGGSLSLTRTFSGYGEVESDDNSVNGRNVSSWSVTRDNNGRIVFKIETVEGVTTKFGYTYDSTGRLLAVTKDSVLVEEYRYDLNGTRTYEMNVQRGIAGRDFSYDDDDHLLTAGSTSYQYDLDGFLVSKTVGVNVTTYDYSSRGELLSVNLPDGRLIEYIHDPLGRRIAKRIDSVIVEKYLWQGMTQLLAVHDGSNNLLIRFEYADDRMPVAMVKEGVTYYLFCDQVGSLRIVADAVGNVVKRIDCDSFGNVISDTDPLFEVPFGFAGGLHDRDTGLVRFGYRDYDPNVGRWTAKDPIGFAGGDTDLYGYVLNDPVNAVDPLGLLNIADAYAEVEGALKPYVVAGGFISTGMAHFVAGTKVPIIAPYMYAVGGGLVYTGLDILIDQFPGFGIDLIPGVNFFRDELVEEQDRRKSPCE